MKIVNLFFISVLFLFPCLAFSDITQEYDAASNKTTIASTIDQVDYADQETDSQGQFDQVSFSKEAGSSFYKLSISLTASNEINFTSGEIKFRGINFELPILEASADQNDNKKTVINKVDIDLSEATGPILTAHQATIILKTRNYGVIVWDIPEYVLDEWKIIIKS